MKREIELSKAMEIANEFIRELSPFCERVEIAGSLRRKKPLVGDIEIMAVLSDLNKFSMKVHELTGFGFKREARYTKIVFKGIQIDLFTPQKSDYFRQFVIRTGSADYVFRNIASKWRQLGWVGTENGLRREAECSFVYTDKEKKKKKWTCNAQNPSLPPIFQSEQEFFAFLNIPYTEPENRI